jgi:AraC-like DNA-binding protein
MSELTIAAGNVLALFRLAVDRGADRTELAERSQIDQRELADQHNRIPFSKYVVAMKAAQSMCSDPAFALHLGESRELTELSMSSLLPGFCDNWDEGLALLNRYGKLSVEVDCANTGRWASVRSLGELWMVDTRRRPNDFPELTESTFAGMFATLRRQMGGNRLVKAIHVTHAEPSYRSEYDRVFQVPIVFESDKNALLVNVGPWLYQRPPSSSRDVLAILTARADALVERLERSRSTSGRVDTLLARHLDSGASVNVIAKALGLSRHTLARRLKAEGTSYGEVLDALRRRLAQRYLADEGVSVSHTAYRLGFADPAAFSRAFKRWTGSSPSAIRRNIDD